MNKVTIHQGHVLEVLKSFPGHHFDSCVCDPPYELGFMGKKWDSSGIAYSVEMWREVLRVLKPGAHLLAFGGSRTYHRLVCAIEDAGFEIRDQIQWIYGSGFPKSLDVSKGIDKAAGAEREVVGHQSYTNQDIRGGGYESEKARQKERLPATITAPSTALARQWNGWGTALKPAHEPIVVARKPLEGTVINNVLKHGTGAINVVGCRIGGIVNSNPLVRNALGFSSDGLIQGETGKGVMSIGRWPANVIHDGSEEVLAAFPSETSQTGNRRNKNRIQQEAQSTSFTRGKNAPEYIDTGSAARFFKKCVYSELELLFIRAKAIIEAWNLELVNTAEKDLSLSNQAAVSVLRNAVTAASLGDKLLKDVKGLSITAMQTELNLLCETLIMAILSGGNGQSPGLWQDEPSPNGCHVRFAETPGQTGTMTITISHWKSNGIADAATFVIMPQSMAVGEKGLKNGSRFTYCAKASPEERDYGLELMKGLPRPTMGSGIGGQPDQQRANNRNPHPTVKPLALMRYLVRLVTPPGGIVLDPFMGSGSTLIAAAQEGFDAVGIDLSPEYCDLAERRARGNLGMLAEVSYAL